MDKQNSSVSNSKHEALISELVRFTIFITEMHSLEKVIQFQHKFFHPEKWNLGTHCTILQQRVLYLILYASDLRCAIPFFCNSFFSFEQSRKCFLSFYGITVISTLGYHKSWVWFRGSMDFYFSPFRAFRRAAFFKHEQLFLHKYKMNSYSWQVGN